MPFTPEHWEEINKSLEMERIDKEVRAEIVRDLRRWRKLSLVGACVAFGLIWIPASLFTKLCFSVSSLVVCIVHGNNIKRRLKEGNILPAAQTERR